MSSRLYVGNLPYAAREDELRQTFAAFGNVVEVHMVIDRDTQRPKGFGFVTMETPEAAQNAIESLDQTQFGGRTLVVSVARERQRSGGRPQSHNW